MAELCDNTSPTRAVCSQSISSRSRRKERRAQGRGAELEDEIAGPSNRKIQRIDRATEVDLAFDLAVATRCNPLHLEPGARGRERLARIRCRLDSHVGRTHARVGNR